MLNQAINFLTAILPMLILLVPLLICVAYLTYVERKVIGYMQLRVGPRVVGPFGLLQPFADAVKLMHKEIILPKNANTGIFLAAPIITFTLSLGMWAVIPLSIKGPLADVSASLLFILAASSLGIYGILLGGWASNSKYPFLGAMRAAAQMVSYEVALGFIVLTIVMSSGSSNLTKIVEAQKNCWYVIPHLPLAFMFFVSALAETNRAPFDLAEAEAELVSGYNVEYSSMPFALFFLAEYAAMILMSVLTSLLFFGGWLPPIGALSFIPGPFWMGLKTSFFLFCFLWVRAALPRYRYDQLMRLGWKIFLPWCFAWMIGTSVVIKWVL